VRKFLFGGLVTFLGGWNVAVASEVKPFVGLDLSMAQATLKNSFSVTSGSIDVGSVNVPAGSSASAKEDINTNAFALKFGAILQSGDRLYLKKATYSKNDGELDLLTIHYDHVFHKTASLNAYVGGHLGQARYDQDNFFDSSSTAYGIQFGLIAPMDKNVEFEASFGYTFLNISGSEEETGLNGSAGVVTFNNASLKAEQEIDTATTINLGINYRF
jgi:hypothetical protein